ncbi:ferredoxin [Mycolicibacterium parafortuitum]|uniref:Ferredoxin n=1 Tax=Mycolicibacterium parafortuitum TaxID=39692 RepID=A0A7I7U321_MYCPF|nr:PDR/VanB family oxidoreductase [Mycolicibacterium parafortuitum]PQE01286.1 oxidoreductase [Mycobacterium sp. EPG1]BBY75355.1 ferredoxin [Mycolicibacterium parafortuitum]
MTDVECPPQPSTVRLVMREYEADVVVAEKTAVADGVVALRLEEVGGHPLPEWEPGAHIDLVMPSGLVRQYSLCGDPGDLSGWRVAVLREPDDRSRGGSVYVHESVEEGSTLRIRGPRNHFRLAPAPEYVFIAGGIGITPILAMVREAEAAGADWRLIYGGRSIRSMAFLDELAVHGDRVDIWAQDERGLIDLASAVGAPRDNVLVYCCGPQALLLAVEQQCSTWPAGSLRVERFSASTADADTVVNLPIEVELARQGVTLTVSADQTILEAIEEHDVPVMSSCRAGMCGTCETPVLSGVPEHRDDVLTHEEQDRNDCMMICVSRSRGDRLVLDL